MTVQPAFLIDSDVLIWCLRKRPRAIALLEGLAKDGPLACSVLTISEIMRMVRSQDQVRTEKLLTSLVALPVGVAEAKVAAILMRNRGPGYVDSHIAATAMLRQLPLVTYNRKDFERTGAKLLDTAEWDPQEYL
jgi:predicted nucleic acid-binding protein